MLDAFQELQSIVDELETSECAATATTASPAKSKVSTSKEISSGELISTARHVKYLVTRRHQLSSLLSQIAELKSSLQDSTEKVQAQCYTHKIVILRTTAVFVSVGYLTYLITYEFPGHPKVASTAPFY